MRSAGDPRSLALHSTRRAGLFAFDRQAAWENPPSAASLPGDQAALGRLQSGNFGRHKKH